MSRLTKPKIKKEGKVEAWYLGQGTVVADTTKCKHEWKRVSLHEAECIKCGLGANADSLEKKGLIEKI